MARLDLECRTSGEYYLTLYYKEILNFVLVLLITVLEFVDGLHSELDSLFVVSGAGCFLCYLYSA
jgi:hypothetical protein